MKRNENKKSNKKVLTVAALALLLGFVGYTGGSTYAKYVTSASAPAQTATVAKWGYVVTADASDLFATDYTYDGTKTMAVKTDSNAGVAVNSEAAGDGDLVVAPGTTGFMTIAVNGKAEVLSELSIVANSTKDVNLTKYGTTVSYYPIKWTVSGNATVGTADLLDGKKLTGLKASEMVTLLNGFSQAKINANTVVDIDLTLTWAWAFDSSEDDAYDTALGALAEGKSSVLDSSGNTISIEGDTEIEFGISLTVAQLAE